MKVKLFDIYNSIQVMNKVLETPLPVSVSYHLGKVFKSLNDELKSVEEQRIKLVEKFGSKEEGKEVSVSDENKEKFLKEFSELLETSVEIEWTPLSVSKFDNIQLTVADLSKISFLFTE